MAAELPEYKNTGRIADTTPDYENSDQIEEHSQGLKLGGSVAVPEYENTARMADTTADYENSDQIEEHGRRLKLDDSVESIGEEDIGIECDYAEIDVGIRESNTQVANTNSKKKHRRSKYDEDNYCLWNSSDSDTAPTSASRPSPTPPSRPPQESSSRSPPHEGVRAFTEKKKGQKSNATWKWARWLAAISCIVLGSLLVGGVLTYFLVYPNLNIPGVYKFFKHYTANNLVYE